MKEYKYKINGTEYQVAIGDIKDNQVEVKVNGADYTVEIEKTETPAPVIKKPVAATPAPAPKPAPKPAPAADTKADPVKSPLPGTIVDINVKVGDSVTPTTVVAVLEAMKMENYVNAGRAGVVKSINVKTGDSVLEGTVILTIG